MSDFDWFGLMKGITELHIRTFASPAPASEDALAGTGGGDSFPSSPLHKFAEEGFRELDNAARCTGKGTVVTSSAIQFHDGMTIERLILAVVVCEERAR